VGSPGRMVDSVSARPKIGTVTKTSPGPATVPMRTRTRTTARPAESVTRDIRTVAHAIATPHYYLIALPRT
jgi:hypothetical protein